MSTDSTKDALLAAAKKVFALKGYEGATVKEVAEEAGANISLVSYHFQGKEGLLRACLEEFGEKKFTAVDKILRPAESVEDFRVRLTLFVEQFYDGTLEDPEVHAILFRDCATMNNPIIQSVFHGTFSKIFELVIAFFEQGKTKNIVTADFDSRMVAMLFLGSMIHCSRMDPVHKELYGIGLDDKTYRDTLIKNTVRLVMEGLVP